MAGNKFKYRLATVLDLRVKKEDKTKQARAAAERERDAEKDKLDELKTRLAGAKKAMGASLQSGQTANVQMGNDYAAALEKKITEQEKVVNAAEEAVVKLEKDVKQCTRDVKILEKHQEKAKDRWKVEEAKKDAAKLDEMSVQGYLKKERAKVEELEADEEREARMAAAAAAELESPWIAGLIQSADIEAQKRQQAQRRRV